MSPDLKIIAIGCAGGVIPDLIRFAKARYDANIADYFKHWNFWLGLLVLVALGGIAAVLGGPATTAQALALGYAAPEFFSKIVAQPPAKSTEESLQLAGFSLRRWWSQ
jgi:hypothetical protein